MRGKIGKHQHNILCRLVDEGRPMTFEELKEEVHGVDRAHRHGTLDIAVSGLFLRGLIQRTGRTCTATPRGVSYLQQPANSV